MTERPALDPDAPGASRPPSDKAPAPSPIPPAQEIPSRHHAASLCVVPANHEHHVTPYSWEAIILAIRIIIQRIFRIFPDPIAREGPA